HLVAVFVSSPTVRTWSPQGAPSPSGEGRTAAMLGSSGVGKSTLLNRLTASQRQEVDTLSAEDRGRHTTTHREVVAREDVLFRESHHRGRRAAAVCSAPSLAAA